MICETKTEVVQTEKNVARVFRHAKLGLYFGFSAHTYLYVLRAICGICVPYFATSSILLYKIGRRNICWCASTKKSMSHRFSESPELMSNFVIVPETWKSARHRFFCAHTPTGGMPPYCIIKYPSDCEIWELNSHYFVFCMQTHVCTEYTPKWDVFCVNTVLGVKYEILGVQRPYCYSCMVFVSMPP